MGDTGSFDRFKKSCTIGMNSQLMHSQKFYASNTQPRFLNRRAAGIYPF